VRVNLHFFYFFRGKRRRKGKKRTKFGVTIKIYTKRSGEGTVSIFSFLTPEKRKGEKKGGRTEVRGRNVQGKGLSSGVSELEGKREGGEKFVSRDITFLSHPRR